MAKEKTEKKKKPALDETDEYSSYYSYSEDDQEKQDMSSESSGETWRTCRWQKQGPAHNKSRSPLRRRMHPGDKRKPAVGTHHRLCTGACLHAQSCAQAARASQPLAATAAKDGVHHADAHQR